MTMNSCGQDTISAPYRGSSHEPADYIQNYLKYFAKKTITRANTVKM